MSNVQALGNTVLNSNPELRNLSPWYHRPPRKWRHLTLPELHDSLDRTVPIDDIDWNDNTVFSRDSSYASTKKWWGYEVSDYLRTADQLNVPIENIQPGTWQVPIPVE